MYIFDSSEDENYQEEVNRLSVEATQTYADEPRYPVMVNSQGEKEEYGRSRPTVSRAIHHADFKCKVDPTHVHFQSVSTMNNCVEAHHLVPMKYQWLFKHSLDVEANINSL